MIQPKTVLHDVHPGPLEEPPPAESKSEESGSSGVAGGEQGGVVGGVVGGQVGGTGPKVEDTPTYPAAGYRKPELAVRGCLQSALSIPREVQRSISGPVTVKFAIRKDGTPTSFQVMGQLEDQRIADVIWKAVTSCHWIPGADPKGEPVSIWVVLPFRFETG
jgi:protein TonB